MPTPVSDAPHPLRPVFDGHNDLPAALRELFDADPEAAHLDTGDDRLHTDVPKIRAGGLAAQFWSVWVPSSLDPATAVVHTLEQIDTVHRLVDAHAEVFRFCRTADDVAVAASEGRVASLIGMEGGHSIDSSLAVLRRMRAQGAAYMTLTHNDDTPWAASATGAAASASTPSPTDLGTTGLTAFGHDVVREMNRIGMLVDLSHVAVSTMHAALDTSRVPVIFSHSSCRAVADHPRNVPDDVLERLPGNGGVLMLTFVPQFVSPPVAAHQIALDSLKIEQGFTTEGWAGMTAPDHDAQRAVDEWLDAHPSPRASIADVVAHLEHARDVVGIDHIGLGGDFDGVVSLPDGLPDVSAYPALFEALGEGGWSDSDLDRLAFDNTLTVLRAAQEAADPAWR